ncbi:hypothetical protein AeRB84_007517 [Aphanomyces euteiches]|nr:hypothetical protein AeRB84_007517 [Aphanomyces euteiches]
MIVACVVVGQETDPFLWILHLTSVSVSSKRPSRKRSNTLGVSVSYISTQLKTGGIPDEVKKLLVRDNKLDPASPLSEELELPLGPNQIHVLVVVPEAKAIVSLPEEEKFEHLLSMLEWREPKRLCRSSGQDWPYQGASNLAVQLTESLAQHYKSWQEKNQDKQNHAIIVVSSGPGTGKSRMLDEMKGLLCEAAARLKNQALVDRMESAYVFHVTFDDDSTNGSALLENPKFDISYRMLYQLAKFGIDWDVFVSTLKKYSSLWLGVGQVMAILAKLEKISNVENMSVILCVDGLQNLANNDTMSCAFYRVLASTCSFLNTSTAFAVCVCSTTSRGPVDLALSFLSQKRLYLQYVVMKF